MAKSSQPWDLNPIMDAFQKAMEGRATDENFNELSLRVKDLKETFKDLTQFLKNQGLYNKELGTIIKNAIEFEKQQTKSKKGQGISQDTSMLHLSQEMSRYFSLSAQGKSKAFNVDDSNPLVKAMKDNLSVYDKLISSINDLQKSIANAANVTGGKLNQAMKSNSGKDSSGGFFESMAGLFGKGNSKKDTDIKDASFKGNAFMKGIGTLIGFLGGSGNGFMGKLSKVLAEYAKKVGIDALRLALYAGMSLMRSLVGTARVLPTLIKGWFKYLKPGTQALGKAVAKKLGITKALKGIKKAAIKSIAGITGKTTGKAAEKAAIKSAVKIGEKTLGKAAAKKIPGLSIAAGIGFGADRIIRDKDWAGGGMEVLSGIAGTVPGVGTAISGVLDAMLFGRDIAKNFMGDKMPEIMKNPFKMLTPMTAIPTIMKDGFNMLEYWNDEKEKRDGERNKTIDKILEVVRKIPGMKWLTGDKDKGKSNDSTLNDSDERRNKIYEKLHHLKELRDSGHAPYLEKKTNVELAGIARDMVDKELGRQSSGVSVGGSIGTGQSYSAVSSGGSNLGDAFFGGNLATVSTGGGFKTAERPGHKGIDLPYPEGTDVKAFLGGKVVYAGWSEGFGNTVGILNTGPDGKQWTNIYAHLSNIGVKVGQAVKRGQLIGKSGHTGYSVSGKNPGESVAPHLHFEVRPTMNKGGSRDPVQYVAAALGYSVDSLPDSGVGLIAASGEGPSPSRFMSEPKGISESELGNATASAEGTSIEQDLKNAYANTQFDQTGNTQFLAAINSIRVRLGKYQQIGMVV